MSLVQYYGQPREGTGLNRVFPYAEEPDFPSSNPRFPTGKYNYKPIIDEISRLTLLAHNAMIPGGRLTLTSNTPVTTSDVTGASTLYYTPYIGQTIALWDTTLKTWIAYPFAQLSYTLSGLTSGRPYDVFAAIASKTITGATNATPIVITSNSHGYANGDLLLISGVEGNYAANGFRKVANQAANTYELQDLDGNSIAGNGAYSSGGTSYKVTLEALAWTSDTARATALTTQNGIYAQSGALNKRYLGTFRTTGTTTTEDSATKRFVWNMYNRVLRFMEKEETSASWSYQSSTYRSLNNSTANRLEYVCGLSEDIVRAFCTACMRSSGAVNLGGLGIGIDSTSATSAKEASTAAILSTDAIGGAWARYTGIPGLGYHYIQALEATNASVAINFYTSNTGVPIRTGIQAEVFA